MSARLENKAVRNFGLAPRPAAYRRDTSNRDATIVAIAILALTTAVIAIYALAYACGTGREISGSMPFPAMKASASRQPAMIQ